MDITGGMFAGRWGVVIASCGIEARSLVVGLQISYGVQRVMEYFEVFPFLLFQTRFFFLGAASRAEIKEKVARQEQEIALLKAQIADGGVEGGDGLSRVDVLEVRGCLDVLPRLVRKEKILLTQWLGYRLD